MGVWCIIVEDCISPYKEWIFFYKYGHYSSLPDFESNSNELFSFQIIIFYSHSI